MATYLVAVSGGVDSVCLLDLLSKTEHRLIVAHVDHGIRDDSAADSRFVAELAKRYKLPFVMARYELGPNASEEQARDVRYDFLFSQAKKHGAIIATAHHKDDLVETIAINLKRGTGWRGLAVLSREGIARPLIAFTKSKLYEYALKNGLEWVEDSTNATDAYQRNRMRALLRPNLPAEAADELVKLRAYQMKLRQEIARETERLIAGASESRHFITQIDEPTALEMLGTVIQNLTGTRPTRPQLVRALHAIKTAKPNTSHHVGSRIELQFTPRNYRVKVV